MSQQTGNFGKILDVDLTSGTTTDFIPPDDYYRLYLGGKGLAARLLWDLLPRDGNTDPLGAENVLIFMVGPLTGHPVMGSSRYVVMTKSPLSKFVAEAYGGGFFPDVLKKTGYDGIIFRGKSNKPVYLEMIDGEVKLVDANKYWSRGVFEVHDDLVEKYGSRSRTAIIGQAGENLVRYAAIINDKNRAAARGGVGAVMGSKMLKAIVVRGKQKSKIVDRDRFDSQSKRYRDGLLVDMNMKDGFGVYGTSGGIPTLHRMNILPTHNFKHGQFEHHEEISGQHMESSGLLVGRDTCATCTTFCKRKIEGEYNHEKLTQDGSSLEYETLASFGSLLMNHNIKLIGYANQLCNDYGLDTISTGVVISYAMEANELGLSDKIGVVLEWNNPEHIIDALHKISIREDYGDILAEGVWRISEKIGGESFAIHTKGMEIAMHEPRGKVGLGLSYATSPRGGTHMEGFHDTMWVRENASEKLGFVKPRSRFEIDGKAAMVATIEDVRSFTNSLVLCAFDTAITGKHYNIDMIQEITSAAMGFEISHDDMLEIGARVYNMWRMVAVREGCIRSDDDLPDRFKNEALHYMEDDEEIVSRISDEMLNSMLDDYYEFRGWDKNGIPKDTTREKLNLP